MWAQLPGVLTTKGGREAGTSNVYLRSASRVNTLGPEFSPALYEGGLVYVSRYNAGPVEDKTGQTFFMLFYADLDPNGVPGKPQAFSAELNSQKHEGPVSFNRKGDRIFFTRSAQAPASGEAGGKGRKKKSNRKKKVELKIYEAQRGYYDWENLRELSFNSNEYTCMHPALSADGERLFFASDMPGGYGGMDLYFVEKRGNTWSSPINMGPEINTVGNEVFPFFHESGMLFFSSTGHEGMGGLDLFMINLSGRKWGKVTPLGTPFNTPNDDFGLVLNRQATRGYFSSNRPGGVGDDDIYIFDAPEGLQGISQPDIMQRVLMVYDGTASKRLIGAGVRVYESTPEGLVNNQELYNLEMVPGSGSSGEMVLKLVRKREEELSEAKLMTDRNGEAVLALEAEKHYLVLISKPGFATKEMKLSPSAESNSRPIEVLMEPTNCVTLDGSLRSSRFSLGVPNALVRIKNNCGQGEQVLRSNLDGVFQACLPMGCAFTITAEKDGFDLGRTEISTEKIRASRSLHVEVKLTPQTEAAEREPIRAGTVLVLENIYYDFNKSAIRRGSADDLEGLARIMLQYPSMEIELAAHTDSRGTEAYNLKLSLARAESAKDFLVSRGISPRRVVALGYGDAFVRNHCGKDVTCTDDEHQYNRRTEVKVIRIDERG